jgi:hypothetical protein
MRRLSGSRSIRLRRVAAASSVLLAAALGACCAQGAKLDPADALRQGFEVVSNAGASGSGFRCEKLGTDPLRLAYVPGELSVSAGTLGVSSFALNEQPCDAAKNFEFELFDDGGGAVPREGANTLFDELLARVRDERDKIGKNVDYLFGTILQDTGPLLPPTCTLAGGIFAEVTQFQLIIPRETVELPQELGWPADGVGFYRGKKGIPAGAGKRYISLEFGESSNRSDARVSCIFGEAVRLDDDTSSDGLTSGTKASEKKKKSSTVMRVAIGLGTGAILGLLLLVACGYLGYNRKKTARTKAGAGGTMPPVEDETSREMINAEFATAKEDSDEEVSLERDAELK